MTSCTCCEKYRVPFVLQDREGRGRGEDRKENLFSFYLIKERREEEEGREEEENREEEEGREDRAREREDQGGERGREEGGRSVVEERKN